MTADEPSVSAVFNGSTITVLGIDEEFFPALGICGQLDPPALPASFASLAEYDFVLDLIATIEDGPELYWIGLFRNASNRGNDAEDFKFLDGTPNLFDKNGEFPWGFLEPDDETGLQFCANIDNGRVSSEGRIIDQDCEGRGSLSSGGVVCKSLGSTTIVIVDVFVIEILGFLLILVLLLLLCSCGLLNKKEKALAKVLVEHSKWFEEGF